MSRDQGETRRLAEGVVPVLIALVLAVAGAAHGSDGSDSSDGAAGSDGLTDRMEVNGVSLAYEVEGSGAPLVLIHGWAVHRGYWDDDVESLASRHTVIRYDRRGSGESTGKSDLSADAADLKVLLETLGHRRAHVLGHSQGGKVALTFAVRYPEMAQSLILFGSGPPVGLELPAGENAPPIAEWVGLAREHGVEAMKEALSAWASGQFGDGSDELAKRARAILVPYTGLDLIDPAAPSNLASPARVDELGSVVAPTLVIVGELEMARGKVAAEALTYGIRGARKVIIPGGGHVVNWSEPERFAAEVLRFLRQVESATGGS